MATALAVRDRVVERFLRQMQERRGREGKHVYYLSLEFLIGRLLRENVGNLGLAEAVKEALAELGVTPDQARLAEPDAALGNGASPPRRLFLECMSSLAIPAFATVSATITGCSADPARGWQQEFPRLALLRQPLGISPAPRSATASASAASRDRDPPRRQRAPSLHPGEWVRRSPTTPGRRLRGRHVTCCGLWRAQRRTRAPDASTAATIRRAGRTVRAERSPMSSTRPTTVPRGRSAAAAGFFFTSAALQDLRGGSSAAGSVDSWPSTPPSSQRHPSRHRRGGLIPAVDEHDSLGDRLEVTRGGISYTNHTLCRGAGIRPCR